MTRKTRSVLLVRVHGPHVRHLRTVRAWSQEKLSEQLKVDVRTVQRIERGRWATRLTLTKLSQVFGCAPIELQTGQESSVGLVIFPPIWLKGAGRGYRASWLGCGGDDVVNPIRQWIAHEADRRPHIRLAKRGSAPLLRITFQHLVTRGTQESWWSAVLFVACDKKGWPEPLDITPYRWLCIDARAYYKVPRAKVEPPIVLRVRLEDNSMDARSGSLHQSTSWNQKDLRLTEFFHEHRCDLRRDFRWSTLAWRTNSRPVNRRAILQVTIGHGSESVPCRGTIEIRRVRFEADGSRVPGTRRSTPQSAKTGGAPSKSAFAQSVSGPEVRTLASSVLPSRQGRGDAGSP